MSLLSKKLSVIASALSDDVRKIPRLARVARFNGLLFDVWSNALNIPELSQTGRREFRQLLAAEDQQLVGLQMDLSATGLSKSADIDRQIERIEKAMQAAASLQSPLLCIDLGQLPRPQIVQKPKPAIDPQAAGIIIIPSMSAPAAPMENSPPPDAAHISLVQSAMSEIGNRAERHGVTIACSTSLGGFAELHETIVAARCPWFGVDLDTVSVLRDEWSRDEIFSAVGSLIRHVRARDAIVGSDRRTKAAVIGRGNLDWSEILGAIDESGYHGFITVDSIELTDRNAGAMQARSFLRAIKQ
jgi:sugar phosphate isomerase/epimerase